MPGRALNGDLWVWPEAVGQGVFRPVVDIQWFIGARQLRTFVQGSLVSAMFIANQLR